MSWWLWLLVAAAGAAGAPVRYVIDTVVSDRIGGVFPGGTLVVNLSGSFLLGVVTGLVLYHGLGPVPKQVVGTGLLGAFTTFSTFSLETVVLAEAGESTLALWNAAASLLAGGLAAAGGWGLAAL
jgi:CrcB protein